MVMRWLLHSGWGCIRGSIAKSREKWTEDEMVGWHHWLNGHESERAPRIGDGQGGLECCSPCGRGVRCDWATELTDWTEQTARMFTTTYHSVSGDHLGSSNAGSKPLPARVVSAESRWKAWTPAPQKRDNITKSTKWGTLMSFATCQSWSSIHFTAENLSKEACCKRAK